MEIRDHALRFDGYLDAVGRQLSTSETLIAVSTRLLNEQVVVEDIINSKEYEFLELESNNIGFEKEISSFLNTDPRERLLFYLIEYFEWFERFSETYTCKKLRLSGANAPVKYLGYLLTCNTNINLFIYVYKKSKS